MENVVSSVWQKSSHIHFGVKVGLLFLVNFY